MNNLSYTLTFIEGVLTFISHCILPLLPVYFFYLAGISANENKDGRLTNSNLVVNSIGFVLGFTIVFVALGAVATSLGYYLKSHRDLLRIISGSFMIFFGLNFLSMGIFKRGFLNFEKRFEYKFERLRFINSIIFGMVFAFGWSPCLGSYYGAALALAANAETISQGSMLLFIYSIGLGIPFIIAAIFFEKLKEQLKAMQKHGGIINIISGIVLILAGILVCADMIKYLGNLTW